MSLTPSSKRAFNVKHRTQRIIHSHKGDVNFLRAAHQRKTRKHNSHILSHIWGKNVPGLWQIGRYESGAWKPQGSAVDSWQTPFLFNPVWSAATNHRHGHHNSPVGTVAPTIIPLLPAESCRFPIPTQPYSASLELFCMLLFKRCPVTAHP